jgi:hypothetical protein
MVATCSPVGFQVNATPSGLTSTDIYNHFQRSGAQLELATHFFRLSKERVWQSVRAITEPNHKLETSAMLCKGEFGQEDFSPQAAEVNLKKPCDVKSRTRCRTIRQIAH